MGYEQTMLQGVFVLAVLSVTQAYFLPWYGNQMFRRTHAYREEPCSDTLTYYKRLGFMEFQNIPEQPPNNTAQTAGPRTPARSQFGLNPLSAALAGSYDARDLPDIDPLLYALQNPQRGRGGALGAQIQANIECRCEYGSDCGILSGGRIDATKNFQCAGPNLVCCCTSG